ncbi:MAG: helix-turn-helix domain-containing protein [Algibacter sp.]
MEVIFLIGAIQTVFLISLVLIKKTRTVADVMLSLGLLLAGIHLFSYYLHTLDGIGEYPLLYVCFLNLPMLHGFLTYAYADTITMKRQKIKWQYVLHLIPYILFTLLLVFLVRDNNYESSEIVPKLLEHHLSVLILFSFCNHFLGPIYILFSIKILRRHRKNIGKWFSSTKNIDLNWLRYILIINIIIWFLVVLISVLGFSSDLINEKSAEYIILTAMTLSVFFIGFFGIKQQVIYSGPIANDNYKVINEVSKNHLGETSRKQESALKYGKSGLNDAMASQIYTNLKTLIRDNAVYKNEELTLVELAKQLKAHPNHLSQVINEKEGKNFYNYINALRIKEFIKIASLPENKKYTMISLAYDCGFSTKSTFNKHFKLQTGKTPTDFFKA